MMKSSSDLNTGNEFHSYSSWTPDKLINSDRKDIIYNVTEDSVSNKRCSFQLFIHQRILKNKKISSPKIWKIDNNHKCESWASDPHIRVISEDWSNDAENQRNKLHFTVYSHREQMIYIRIIFHYFSCIFFLIKLTVLVSLTTNSYILKYHFRDIT